MCFDTWCCDPPSDLHSTRLGGPQRGADSAGQRASPRHLPGVARSCLHRAGPGPRPRPRSGNEREDSVNAGGRCQQKAIFTFLFRARRRPAEHTLPFAPRALEPLQKRGGERDKASDIFNVAVATKTNVPKKRHPGLFPETRGGPEYQEKAALLQRSAGLTSPDRQMSDAAAVEAAVRARSETDAGRRRDGRGARLPCRSTVLPFLPSTNRQGAAGRSL